MNVRFVRPGDAAAIAAIYAPMVTESVISFEAFAPDAAEIARRIAAHDPGKPWLVMADETDRAVGYAYAGAFRGRHAYRFSAEVTVYVAREAHRRRIGTTLYAVLRALLREQGYRRAFGYITLPNAASVALHLAQGFTPAGVTHAAGYKFGRWHDVGCFECALRDTDTPDADPVPLASLDPVVIARLLDAPA